MNRLIALVFSLFICQALVAQPPVPNEQFFKEVDSFMGKYVLDGKVKYADLKANPAALVELCKVVDEADLKGLSDVERKAFYINAYNLTLIKAILLAYPCQSPNDIPGIFDGAKHKVAGKYMTLNDLENETIRKEFDDARIHFALVCGALSCPVIINTAYSPASLDEQLDQQTRAALNDATFLKVDHGALKAELSQIFKWYAADFGNNNKELIGFINKYRKDQIPLDYKLSYYTYDWTLNDAAPNGGGTILTNTIAQPASANRFMTSTLLGKGKWELKLFNNTYTARSNPAETENANTFRGTYFSSFVQFLYGVNSKLSVGVDAIYKANRNDSPIESWTKVFAFESDNISSRAGLTAIGPKFKIAPFKRAQNISIQSSFMFSVIDDPLGKEGNAYVDNGHHWWTQVFYDLPLSDKISLFLEADVFAEIEPSFDLDNSSVFTPLKSIVSYFPGPKWTVYGLTEFAPTWGDPYVYYTQMGLGVKYLITDAFEIETLITNFSSSDAAARESTYNFGIRYTRL